MRGVEALSISSLFIIVCGAAALAAACGFYDDEPRPVTQLPLIAIDGPFGTSSEDLFRFDAAVCVAAGFVSLSLLCYRCYLVY